MLAARGWDEPPTDAELAEYERVRDEDEGARWPVTDDDEHDQFNEDEEQEEQGSEQDEQQHAEAADE
eukprot:gene23314-47186_t